MISDLRKIEFHDLPVKALSMDFIDGSILLVVKDYDEKKQEYFEIDLLFMDISSFYFQKVRDIHIEEIYECSLKAEGELYFIEFTMLSGAPTISCTVSFYFRDVKVDFKGSSNW